jgi:hypothetical protein
MADYYAGPSASTTEAMFEWEPSSVELFDLVPLTIGSEMEGITSLTINISTNPALSITSVTDLASLSFPNLVSITDGGFEIAWNTSLSSLNLSALETVYDTLSIAGILLTSLDLGSLATAIVSIHDNPNLTDITLTNFVPTNDTENYFNENALSAATVNAILARFVANAAFVTGVIDLSGGTNAAPTGQGLTDVTTLLARGVTVTVTE